MKNEELINALRWCQKRGCSKCVALLDNGSCKYGGAIKIFDAAADALEVAEKRIAELEEEHNKTVTAISQEEQLWWENRCKELEAERMELIAKWRRLEARIPELEKDIIYWQTYAAEIER